MNIKISSLTLFISYLVFFFEPIGVFAAPKDDNTQMAIHLLDYISRNYAVAVEDGEIINSVEYNEMREFSTTVYELLKHIKKEYEKKEVDILPQVAKLKILIQEKAEPLKVVQLARKIKLELIEVTGYRSSPLRWPDYSKGKQSYANFCISCHGMAGNGKGPLAHNLPSAPTNFLNDELMEKVSPFHIYNTIQLGVQGTGMRAFPELTDEEVWDLAFYIKSLRFRESGKEIRASEDTKALEEVDLTDVAGLSDQELLNKWTDNSKLGKEKLRALRLHIPPQHNSLDLAKEYLKSSVLEYKKGNISLARQHILAAYLDGIEPVEVQLRAKDPAFAINLEKQMFQLRKAIEEEDSPEAVTDKVNLFLELISRAENMMKSEKLGFWLSFLFTVSILLREGLEAFLIIAVVLTIIRAAKVKKALPWLHGGWLTAIIFGFAVWYLSDFFLQLSGQNREMLEGGVALLSVLVLTYVGFWLHVNSHVKRWKDFVEQRIYKLLKTENMFGLALFSFLVVFREVFESVLFLQGIKMETLPENHYSIGLGVLVTFVLIAVLVVLFVKYSQKIPIRQLFLYSSWIIIVLALIFMGKGLHSIQESGWLSITSIHLNLRIEWLGIYSTAESLLGQGLLLIFILDLWYISSRRNKIVR